MDPLRNRSCKDRNQEKKQKHLHATSNESLISGEGNSWLKIILHVCRYYFGAFQKSVVKTSFLAFSHFYYRWTVGNLENSFLKPGVQFG